MYANTMSDYKDTDIVDRYFHLNYFILKVAGIWIPNNTDTIKEKTFHYAYDIFWLIYCLLLYQPAESAVMFQTWNLLTIVRSLRDQFNHLICIYKLYVWFTKRKLILNVIKRLQSKRFVYDGDEEYVKSNEIFKRHKKESEIWARIFLFGVNFICLNMCFSVLYLFIFHGDEQYKLDDDGNLIYAQVLPALLIVPYKRDTRITFILTFIFEILALDIYGWMIIGLDTLFTSLMSCISAHLCIIQEAFRTIRPRCLKKLKLSNCEMLHDNDELNREMLLEMKKCTEHLQMIIEISDKLEYVYNIQTCGQVLTSLFEMCFCLFLLSTSFDENFGPEFTYLFSTAFELLLYCWFGNSVTEASQAIPEALFNADWLSASTPFKKDMLITMTRMKKPICLTIAKFTPLTFTTFLSIGRVAYSFFTVLKSATN